MAGPRLDFLDKVCVAASSAELGCTNCPTWEFELQGTPDPAPLRQALVWLLARYWPARSRVVPRGGHLLRAIRLDFDVSETADPDDFLTVVDTDPPGLTVIQAQVRDRHLDWTREWPLHLTLVRLPTGDSHLLVQQHHGLADGRAFMDMLADLQAFWALAQAGDEPTPEQLAPVVRHGELAPLGLGLARAAWWGFQGWCWLAYMLARGVLRPLTPLFQNLPNDYTGPNRTRHLDLDDQALATWRPRYRAAGLSLNTVLTVALFVANQRWNADHRVVARKTNAFLIAETRPRDGSFQSFANHLASFVVDLPLHRGLPLAQLCRDLHAQMVFRAKHRLQFKRYIFERAMGLILPVGVLRQAVLQPTTVPVNLNFSNLIPLPFTPLEGPGWCAERCRITTPVTPRTAVVLTVIRYRGQLTFNFNHKVGIVSAEQIEGLVGHFQQALDDVIATLPKARG